MPDVGAERLLRTGPPPPPPPPPPPMGRPSVPPPSPGHVVPRRPLGVGDVLDAVLTILRRGARPLAAIVLVLHLPFQVVSAVVRDRLLPAPASALSLTPWLDAGLPVEQLTRLVTVTGATAIVALLVHVITGAAVVVAIVDLDHGRAPRPGEALRRSASVSGATLGATVLLGVATLGLASVLSTVVAVLAAVAGPLGVVVGLVSLPVLMAASLATGLLALPVAVIEETGPLVTLVQAARILRARFWWIVGTTLLVVLLLVAVWFTLALVLGVVALLLDAGEGVIAAVSGVLGALIAVPFSVGIATVIYHEARRSHRPSHLQSR